ncbi:hypothetical protein G7Y89_g12185 [Cudoniella acicularis]|uniref:NB-ARC domain-containing protein n=1 Tax=Cudoniella acicularis TaxID=354080 RepID=A0A8H4VX95_9HELO|nr:hypothetical protein G7Y89_g12185 [Cudoniella acicularis]
MAGLACLWEDSKYQNHHDAVDIVAVHGLGGHYKHSWTDVKTEALWLRDFIPKRIQTARVLSFGYTLRGLSDHTAHTSPEGSVPTGHRGLNKVVPIQSDDGGPGKTEAVADSAFARRISNIANTLVTELYTDRGFNKCQQRPIIFVCHGLGGTIVKEAIAQSDGHKTWSDITTGHSILVSAHAILFFSTPFASIDASTWTAMKTAPLLDAWINKSTLDMKLQETGSGNKLHREANKVSEVIVNAMSRFINLPVSNHPRLCFLWEDMETNFGYEERVVVPQDTAAPTQIVAERCGIDATYNTMVKFGSESSCKVVLSFLERCCVDAPNEVRGRWKVAHANNHNSRKQQASEMMGSAFEPSSPAESGSNKARKVMPTKFFRPPAQGTWRFVGRSQECQIIKEALLNSNEPQRRFVISGIGGSGKTELCRKFAEDNKEMYSAVFTIMAKSRESAADSYASIGKITGLSTAATEEQGKEWLAVQTQPWLLIIDNADDPDLDLGEFFPSRGSGHILVTTRNPSFWKYATVGHLNLAGLDEDDALQLLLDRAQIPQPCDDKTRKHARKVVKRMGCLARAIVQAGASIMCHQFTLDKYLPHWELYRAKRREMRAKQQKMKAKEQETKENPEETKASMNEDEDKIFASFDVSLEHLEQIDREDCKDAIDLLKIVSFYHFDSIPIEIFSRAMANRQKTNPNVDSDMSFSKQAMKRVQPPAALPQFIRQDGQNKSEFRINSAIKMLCSVSFASLNPGGAGISIHPLLREWAQDSLNKKMKLFWGTIALNVLAESVLLPPANAGASHAEFRKQLLPHLHTCLNDPIFQPKAIAMPDYAKWWGKFKLYSTVLLRPTALYFIREKGILVAKCGYIYASCGQFTESLTYFRQVKDLLLQVQGDKNPRTMTAMLALAGILWGLGKRTNVEEAILLQKRVVDARKSVLGKDHPDTLRAMAHLSKSYWLRGYHQEALELQEETITHMRQHQDLGPDHPDTLETLDQYGVTLGSFLRFKESLDTHRKVLDARTKKFQVFRRQTSSLMDQMHLGRRSTSSAGSKDDHNNNVRSTDEDLDLVLGLLNTKQNLAMAQLDSWLTSEVKSDRSLLNEAFENMLEVLHRRRQLLGEEHPWTLWAVGSYAKVIIELDQLQEAEELLLRGIPAANRGLGEGHPGVLMGCGELVKVYSRQGEHMKGEARRDKYSQAEKEAKIIIAQIQKASGADHPDVVFATWKLSKLYARQGKWEDAARACTEALQKGDLRLTKDGKTYPLCTKIKKDLQDLKRMLPPDPSGPLPAARTDIAPKKSLKASPKLFSRRTFTRAKIGTW